MMRKITLTNRIMAVSALVVYTIIVVFFTGLLVTTAYKVIAGDGTESRVTVACSEVIEDVLQDGEVIAGVFRDDTILIQSGNDARMIRIFLPRFNDCDNG